MHHIPGRMRVKLPKRDAAGWKKIRKSISEMPGVKSVETNPSTGSVVVSYDPAKYDQFSDSLADHAGKNDLFSLKPPDLTEVDEMAGKIEAEAEFLAEHSRLARGVVDLFKQVNQQIKIATGNSVDLKVLIPLGLAAYLITSEDSSASTPLWVTLCIFSFNSFVALHHTQATPQPPTEDRNPPRSPSPGNGTEAAASELRSVPRHIRRRR